MENNELLQMLRTVMQEELKPVIQRLDNMDSRIGNIENRIGNIETRIGKVETHIDTIKGQLDENTSLIKSLMHRTEELSAQFDGLLHNTVTKECIATLATKEDMGHINAKLDALNTRLFYQEAEMCRLKVAQ